MTEIYNFRDYGFAYFNLIFVLIAVPFVVAFFIAVIRIINMIVHGKSFTGNIKSYLVNIFCIMFIPLFSYMLISGVIHTFNDYSKYTKIMEDKTYIIENGVIENFDYYNLRNQDNYVITFNLNGQYFDSLYCYGECDFSDDDIAMIKNSSYVEVKYTTNGGNNIILSMSVEQDSPKDKLASEL